MSRSSLITTIGVLAVFFGVYYFFSPPPNDYGDQVRTEYSMFVSGWLVLSGLGLIWHYRWGFYAYLAGLAILLVYGLSASLRHDVPFESMIGVVLLTLLIFGLPGALVFWKRDNLRAFSKKSETDA